jgi:hypothetical protein
MIDQTPGASRTIGMEMITDYVPGAYMTHDMLHMRGGHQTSWLIDGIAIPNTKIASNVGPQIDPKDIDSLETQRGSYAADVGDRTYGVFNVLPRNGFERTAKANCWSPAGNFYTGETQLSLGDHSESDRLVRQPHRLPLQLRPGHAGRRHLSRRHQLPERLSLADPQPDPQRSTAPERPVPPGLTSRFPTIPTPTTGSRLQGYYNSYGLRDAQTERDSFVIANWVHTLSPKALFSVAPFYHFNQANYDSPANRLPRRHHLASDLELRGRPGRRASGRRSEQLLRRPLLVLSGGERPLWLFRSTTASAPTQHSQHPANANAGLVEFYLSDHLRLGRYITLLGGERFSIYRAGTTSPPSIRASAQPSKFPACTGSCAASTATSSSPRRSRPSPVPC